LSTLNAPERWPVAARFGDALRRGEWSLPELVSEISRKNEGIEEGWMIDLFFKPTSVAVIGIYQSIEVGYAVVRTCGLRLYKSRVYPSTPHPRSSGCRQ
jgi:hypothetical protein